MPAENSKAEDVSGYYSHAGIPAFAALIENGMVPYNFNGIIIGPKAFS